MRALSKTATGLKAGGVALLLLVAAGWTAGSNLQTLAAYADNLTADQSAAIQSMVQTALANINPSLTGQARQDAIAAALAQVMTNAIQTYGNSAIASVTGAAVTAGVPVAQVVAAVLPAAAAGAGVSSAVASIVTGAAQAGGSASDATQAVIVASANYSPTDVGTGLGAAAAQLSGSNPAAAEQIAAAVSNEGTTDMGSSFSTSVVQNGGSQQLADAGTQNPQATGDVNSGNQGNDGNQQNGNDQGLPPCSNPSCT
jgi:hypothetical protein